MTLDGQPAPGNPFHRAEDLGQAANYVWAYGFRNPWRMSFDQVSGALWLADVGWELWELVFRVQRGGNYGWSIVEGSHPFYPNRKQGPHPISKPIAAGDQLALHALYERAHRLVFTLMVRITCNRATAEELTLDVVGKLHQT